MRACLLLNFPARRNLYLLLTTKYYIKNKLYPFLLDGVCRWSHKSHCLWVLMLKIRYIVTVIYVSLLCLCLCFCLAIMVGVCMRATWSWYTRAMRAARGYTQKPCANEMRYLHRLTIAAFNTYACIVQNKHHSNRDMYELLRVARITGKNIYNARSLEADKPQFVFVPTTFVLYIAS